MTKKSGVESMPDFVPEEWAPIWEPLNKDASALNTGYSLGYAGISHEGLALAGVHPSFSPHRRCAWGVCASIWIGK